MHRGAARTRFLPDLEVFTIPNLYQGQRMLCRYFNR
jgi:hypothetical protein